MAGLLDFLSMLQGGMQPQQGMQQGLLSQGMQQQNPLRDLSLGLLKANQPSRYKKNFGQLLGEATLNAEDMGMQRRKSEADIAKDTAMTNLYGAGGSGGTTLKATQAIMAANPNLSFIDAYSIAKSGLGQGITMNNGQVAPLTGAPEAAGAMKFGETTGGNQSDLIYKPKIKKAETDATNLAEAQKNLGTVSDTANTALRYVKELKTHKGKSDVVGAKNVLSGAVTSYIPFYPTDAAGNTKMIPGTDAANFEARRKQLVGGTFLEAYNTLKGGGQITEVEGNKAQDAIARMDTAQTEQEFDKALADYESIIKLGLSRARNKAGVSVSDTAPDGTSVNIGGVTSYQDYFK